MSKNIVDSLFLELGIDVSKFSQDQQKALGLIQKFEAQAKRSGKGAADGVKTVGKAFDDVVRSTRIGSSFSGIDSLATKLKNLGQSAQVSGGIGAPLGAMSEGLGMLLSPAALGIAAVGLLGKGMWDLNKNMTATNATMYRQAQLSGVNAENLWAWGEAARTVGANPMDVTGGITALQNSIQGMGIGAGDATSQLVALSRLGVGFDFNKGADLPKLFARVHEMAKARGNQNLGALRALTAPVMNDAMFNIATNPGYNPNDYQKQIKAMEPKDLGATLQNSLKSQQVLGELGIKKDILDEVAYGGEQGLFQAMVQLLASILDITTKILNVIMHPIQAAKDAYSKTVDATTDAIENVVNNTPKVGKALKDLVMPPAVNKKISAGMQALMDMGVSKDDAAAIIGNATQESSMNPYARNKGHAGLLQWDKERQEQFRKRFGYSIGATPVPEKQQMKDQLAFAVDELRTTQTAAAAAMEKAKGLLGKTSAFMDLDERPGDDSLTQRYAYAQVAERMATLAGMVAATNSKSSGIQNTVTNDTTIGTITVHTAATDAAGIVGSVRGEINRNPLINLPSQGTVSLATRGMSN